MYSVETVLQLSQNLRQDSRHSQIRTLAMLFASSLFVYLILGEMREFVPFMGRILMVMIAIFNTCAWLIWLSSQYFSLFGNIAEKKEEESRSRRLEDESPEGSYQFDLYRYHRQRRLETMIAILVAFQFIVIGFVFSYIWIVPR